MDGRKNFVAGASIPSDNRDIDKKSAANEKTEMKIGVIIKVAF